MQVVVVVELVLQLELVEREEQVLLFQEALEMPLVALQIEEQVAEVLDF
jgi:hypothetical protein